MSSACWSAWLPTKESFWLVMALSSLDVVVDLGRVRRVRDCLGRGERKRACRLAWHPSCARGLLMPWRL